MRDALRAALAVAALVVAPAGAASGLTFDLLFSFGTGVFGPDRAAAGEGTPTGVAIGAGGNPLISDSLDDHIYETDASGNLLRVIETNPYCELSGPPTCAPGVPSHSAGFADDLAREAASGHIWLLDDPSQSGAFLHELDGDGLFLAEFDISHTLTNGGGLIFDSRNGDLLLTDIGSREIVRLDENDPDGLALAFYSIPDVSAPVAITEYQPGLFLVLDSVQKKIFEYAVPAGAGSATLLGTSVLTGDDLSTSDPLGLAWDASAGRLYVTDNNLGDEVLVFAPEPGTGSLLALGVLALSARRAGRRRPTS